MHFEAAKCSSSLPECQWMAQRSPKTEMTPCRSNRDVNPIPFSSCGTRSRTSKAACFIEGLTSKVFVFAAKLLQISSPPIVRE